MRLNQVCSYVHDESRQTIQPQCFTRATIRMESAKLNKVKAELLKRGARRKKLQSCNRAAKIDMNYTTTRLHSLIKESRFRTKERHFWHGVSKGDSKEHRWKFRNGPEARDWQMAKVKQRQVSIPAGYTPNYDIRELKLKKIYAYDQCLHCCLSVFAHDQCQSVVSSIVEIFVVFAVGNNEKT